MIENNNSSAQFYFGEAALTGISNDAIVASVNEDLELLSSHEAINEKFRNLIKIIIKLKDFDDSKINLPFQSKLLQNDGAKLMSAFRNGISQSDIAHATQNINDISRDDLFFVVARLKEYEIKLLDKAAELKREKAKEKILVNTNENQQRAA